MNLASVSKAVLHKECVLLMLIYIGNGYDLCDYSASVSKAVLHKECGPMNIVNDYDLCKFGFCIQSCAA